MTAPTKFLGEIDLDVLVSHVAIHMSSNGKMGSACQLEHEGQISHLFPLELVTRDWISAIWGPGEYRFAFYLAKGKDAPKRIGPRGGAIQITGQLAPPKKLPADVAAPAKTAKLDGVELFGMLRTIQAEERAAAQEFARSTIERDRIFYRELSAASATARGPSGAEIAALVKQAVEDALPEEEDDKPAGGGGASFTEGDGTMLEKAAAKLAEGVSKAIDAAIAGKFSGASQE